ncbi:MAG: prephenate dehydratase [Shimia sp.]
MPDRIAFQGALGAYGHEACATARPDHDPLPCATFEDTFAAVTSGEAALAMLPVENSTYGRVADIHRLLPASGLRIVDEAFVRVRVCCMSLPGTTLADIHTVRAHMVLLPQCQRFLDAHGLRGEISADSAGAAADLAQHRHPGVAVLASEMAARTYGLDVLARDVEDMGHNTTRFLVMAPKADDTRRAERMITSFVFEVRNLPAALYKAMGGFATNGVNMTKLESYMVGGQFTATQFYADVEGHPGDRAMQHAFEELGFFTNRIEVLGTYPADPRRD